MTGRYHRCLKFLPEIIPIITEYAGFTIKNSNMQRAIPAHSEENFATAAGRRYITTTEIAIILWVTFLCFVMAVIVICQKGHVRHFSISAVMSAGRGAEKSIS